MNKELLLKVADAIEANPDHFDMENWFSRLSCGSTACIIGWAVAIHFEKDLPDAYAIWLSKPNDELSEILGIKIFSKGFDALAKEHAWLRKDLGERFARAKEPATQAKVAAEYVRWFVENGEAEQ